MLLAIAPALAQDAASPKGDGPSSRFTISRETTRLLGPLTPDGRVDYTAAINRRASQGVTPSNNAAVLGTLALTPGGDET